MRARTLPLLDARRRYHGHDFLGCRVTSRGAGGYGHGNVEDWGGRRRHVSSGRRGSGGVHAGEIWLQIAGDGVGGGDRAGEGAEAGAETSRPRN